MSDWLWERATDLADLAVGERHNMGMYAVVTEAATAALQDAIDRTRSEERALAAEALGMAMDAQEKAVDAERERCAKIADAYANTKPILEASTNAVQTKIIATVMSDTGRKIAAAIRGTHGGLND